MRQLKLSPRLYDALINQAMDQFTILELRDTHFASSTLDADSTTKAYKTAYRQVERLVRMGLLAKSKPKNSAVCYLKTEAFHNAEFAIRKTATTWQNHTCHETTHSADDESSLEMSARLQELARTYQVDLLTSIGESEEYIRLYNDFPELKPQLEPQYLSARERSSKLLGKIKALDTVLAQLQQISRQ